MSTALELPHVSPGTGLEQRCNNSPLFHILSRTPACFWGSRLLLLLLRSSHALLKLADHIAGTGYEAQAVQEDVSLSSHSTVGAWEEPSREND